MESGVVTLKKYWEKSTTKNDEYVMKGYGYCSGLLWTLHRLNLCPTGIFPSDLYDAHGSIIFSKSRINDDKV
jgi:hypothetical protein